METKTELSPIECSKKKKDDNISFSTLKNQLQQLKQQLTLINQTANILEKNMNKQEKQLNKNINKNKGVKRAPSGFAKPCLVTDELCDFMKKEKGAELARTDVTKFLIKYIWFLKTSQE